MSCLCGWTVVSGEGLVDIGDDVGDVLDAYRESDEVGGYAGFAQLLVGELTVGVAGGVEHARAGVGHMGDYGYESESVHEAYGVFTGAFEAEGYDAA